MSAETVVFSLAPNGMTSEVVTTEIAPIYAASLYNYYKHPSDPIEDGTLNNLTLMPRYHIDPSLNISYGLDPSAEFITSDVFFNAFYPFIPSGQTFSLNKNFSANLFNLSTYTLPGQDNTIIPFNLIQSVLQAYCTNKNINPNDMSTSTLICLSNELIPFISLPNIKGTTYAHSYNQLMETLNSYSFFNSLNSGDRVIVPLYVTINIRSNVVDTNLVLNLLYKVLFVR